jgi:hypothetical protein
VATGRSFVTTQSDRVPLLLLEYVLDEYDTLPVRIDTSLPH